MGLILWIAHKKQQRTSYWFEPMWWTEWTHWICQSSTYTALESMVFLSQHIQIIISSDLTKVATDLFLHLLSETDYRKIIAYW